MSYTLAIGCGGGMPLESLVMLCAADGPSGYDRVIEHYLNTRPSYVAAGHDVRFESRLGACRDDDFIELFQCFYPQGFVAAIVNQFEPPLVAIDVDANAAMLARRVTSDLGLGIDVRHASLGADDATPSLAPIIAQYGLPSTIIGSYSLFECGLASADGSTGGRQSTDMEPTEAQWPRQLLASPRCVLSFIEHPHEIERASGIPKGPQAVCTRGADGRRCRESARRDDVAAHLVRCERLLGESLAAASGRRAEVEIGFGGPCAQIAALLHVCLTERR